MASTISEAFESRSVTSAGRNSTVRRKYFVDEMADEAAAVAAVISAAPASFTVGGYVLDEVTAEGKFINQSESGTDDEYEIDVTWKSPESRESQNNNQSPGGPGSPDDPESDPTYHISFGMDRARIYEARAQDLMTGGVAGTSDIGNRLHDDGTKVEGLDVPVPTGRHTERRTYLASVIDRTWIRTRLQMLRTTNSEAIGPYNVGELFFDEISIQYRTDGYVDVDFGWDFQENIDEYDAHGQTFEKRGHEYVWARYTPTVTAGKVDMVPTHVYRAILWPEADHASLF
jgi:hypothetical protein